MGINRDVARGCYRTISEQFDAEGRFYFEMYIRTWRSGKTWCDFTIHLKDPDPHAADDLLIGVEVKDWKDPVPPSVIKKEFKGYRHQFDYFYFAANEFAPSVDEMDNDQLGLIEMGDYEIIEQPRPQPTISWNREAFVECINRNWNRNTEDLEDDFPDLYSRVEDGKDRELAEYT